MKKQEVLDFMKWDKLPKAVKASNLKCPVLVKRTNKVEDYAISNQGRIVADKRFKASITKVIEYYPQKVTTKAAAEKVAKDKAAADQVIADQVIADQIEADKTDSSKVDPIQYDRIGMIDFLVSKGAERNPMQKTKNKKLAELCKEKGKEF